MGDSSNFLQNCLVARGLVVGGANYHQLEIAGMAIARMAASNKIAGMAASNRSNRRRHIRIE